ncbi:uncharacterized protein PHACADRAFT_210814 [Phanerochaete carnosa HHB-10118-sp]|uniref:DUF6534 domain-containing protein n=1 Tax=Phanerochaete carnosa (strain HHB-10118-sp) TaxID=650164 RepID=K5VNP0_PHACS|nr:uncharacterized protein PHACADRAFT_210814 [Phanerochaete carnosa HHB-10118-sp]EKM53098.1 hypothetical protein PHACADRAFT_210814 [Phanerochaete carnosa HHB-10118-sp]
MRLFLSQLGSLDGTLGGIVIAEILVAVLYGIASIQVYVYFHYNLNDSPLVKRTIFSLWILSSLYLVLASHAVYYYVVTNSMNPSVVTKYPWSLVADLFVGDLIEVTVSLIFTYKIYRLNRCIWSVIFIVLPQVISFIGAIANGILDEKFPGGISAQGLKLDWLWCAMFGLQAVTDCAIAATLCTILVKRRTGFKRTNSLIRVLLLYSIGTFALTSSISIASVVTYITIPHNYTYIALAMVLPKLMYNSLLALLNSRDTLRNMYIGQIMSVHPSDFT